MPLRPAEFLRLRRRCAIAEVTALSAGLVQLLLARVNELSGLDTGARELDAAAEAPLVRAAHGALSRSVLPFFYSRRKQLIAAKPEIESISQRLQARAVEVMEQAGERMALLNAN